MINLIKANKNDTDFLKSLNLQLTDDIYTIYSENKLVGVIKYKEEINSHYEDEPTTDIHIDLIEVLKEFRRNGIATKVIQQLLSKGEEVYISGEAIPDSVEFWLSLGADFGGEEESLEYYKENNLCLGFSL